MNNSRENPKQKDCVHDNLCTELPEVVEMCPHCENEATLYHNCAKDGYETNCPNCGEQLMLCSECMLDGDNKCDWSEENGCYRNNYGICSLAFDFCADIALNENNEPQAYITLKNGRLIEVCHERNMLPRGQWFYSIRLHCTESEEDNYSNTIGIISTHTAKSIFEMQRIISELLMTNNK